MFNILEQPSRKSDLVSSEPASPDAFEDARFADFLQQHLDQDLLRFTTAGSVDDGKSTLIGRLLHDTKSVYEDQLAAIKKSRINRAAGPIDFSLLTDGLRAEREQGITIDVAYRYFSTARRKFIIADTPGHEQYTRNMATGASNAHVAIVLLDGSKGLLPQSRRHTFIASLLGIPYVVAAVNKMDLAGYSETRFLELRSQFISLARQLGIANIEVIPVSALEGDNVVHHGDNMPWYTGPTLLEYLEEVPVQSQVAGDVRFPVQLVSRPDSTFRGFAGQVAGGVLRPGDQVVALPSRQTTRIHSIVTYDGDLPAAQHPMSITLRLEDEIDLSRGDMLASPGSLPSVSRTFEAMVVWMHADPFVPGRSYLIKHTSRQLRASATAIEYRVDVNTFEHLAAEKMEMNDIACVRFQSASPLLFDPYRQNRLTGSFILIDPISNATLGAAMITRAIDSHHASALDADSAHHPALILIPGRDALADRLLDALNASGHRAVSLDDDHIPVSHLASAVRVAQLAGVTAITTATSLPPGFAAQLHAFAPPHQVIDAATLNLPADDDAALRQLLSASRPSGSHQPASQQPAAKEPTR
ncbi:MAG: sulfate adenylyltransferase subunit CysN [Acidobacteriaceae bacterium]